MSAPSVLPRPFALRARRAAGATAAAFALLLVAPTATAQPAVAQKEMVLGDQASKAGKWEDALAAYRRAHAASPSGATALRVANALYKLGRLVEAHDAYESLLKERAASLLGSEKKLATDRLDELKGKTGTVVVTAAEGGAAVTLDGASIGVTPVPKAVRVVAGKHKVAATKNGFVPFEEAVDVAGRGEVTVAVKLAAPKAEPPPPAPTALPKQGTLEVRTEQPKSQISVDGAVVGQGSFKGDLPEGEHLIEVSLDGYARFEKRVTVVAGEVVAETIVLRKAAAGTITFASSRPWSFDGLYGGFQLVGMFEPAGSGSTLDAACAVTGATACEGSIPMGGAIAGYVGYAFAPVGLELFLLGGGDVSQPTATFDGVTGSEVNPLVASPAREESFIIGRFGGGGAARLRVLFPFDRVRITGAVGAGAAYRHLILGRDTVAEDGSTSSFGADGDGYVTGVLSVELAVHVLLGGTTALSLGGSLWVEHAGDGVSTPARTDAYLTGDGPPQPQATPAYDMASGTQLFVGPVVGLHFGP
jgi:hypothetical protein